MELNKDDIKTIGYRRFNKSHQRLFYGLIFGGLALLVGLILALLKYRPEEPQIALVVAIVIFVLMYVGLWLYNKAADKAAKSFVEECEANPTLTYIPEPTKEVEKVTE